MAFMWGFIVTAGVMLAIWAIARGLAAWRRAHHKRAWPATRLREMDRVGREERREQDLPFVGTERRAMSDMLSAALGDRGGNETAAVASPEDEPVRRRA
jgi:hypothetical protein